MRHLKILMGLSINKENGKNGSARDVSCLTYYYYREIIVRVGGSLGGGALQKGSDHRRARKGVERPPGRGGRSGEQASV